MTTIGLIGAGKIGGQLARLAVKNGYDVVLSNSRGPETLANLVKELGPKARAATPLEAAKAGDIVVVTIPLKNHKSVPVEPLAGKIVIDTNNYYPQRDGHIPELDKGPFLLCDDIYDSGNTIRKIREIFSGIDFDIAVVLAKKPIDGMMCGEVVEHDRWVDFFWEVM